MSSVKIGFADIQIEINDDKRGSEELTEMVFALISSLIPERIGFDRALDGDETEDSAPGDMPPQPPQHVKDALTARAYQ